MCCKDSKTSNLGAVMHRVPDDCNALQLSFRVLFLQQSTVLWVVGYFSVSTDVGFAGQMM